MNPYDGEWEAQEGVMVSFERRLSENLIVSRSAVTSTSDFEGKYRWKKAWNSYCLTWPCIAMLQPPAIKLCLKARFAVASRCLYFWSVTTVGILSDWFEILSLRSNAGRPIGMVVQEPTAIFPSGFSASVKRWVPTFDYELRRSMTLFCHFFEPLSYTYLP